MSEKVILPNFDLPRDSTRVAMRALWVMGGVVVLATLVLGLAMWHHRSLEIATAEQAAAKAEAARRAAMAPPPAPKVVETAPRVVERPGSATTLANVAPGSASDAAPAAAGDNARPATSARRHSSKAGRSHMRGTALLDKIEGKKSAGAKAAVKTTRADGRKPKSDDDFIDSLLKK